MLESREPQHVVLADADAEGFASLRRPATPRSERYAIGRALRGQAPRSLLGHWEPPADRPDPVQQVAAANQGRVERLVPVRVGRIAASPFAFLRGAAAIMAEDFARLPATGITPVICGDAHLSNFGFYASPERDLVFDLNDFDEAHPGAWEWDLRRLVTSVFVAGRHNGASEEQCGAAAARCVGSYREHLAHLAEDPLLQRAYERIDLDRLRDTTSEDSMRREIDRAERRARKRTSDRALRRFTEAGGDGRRIVEEPPLITRPDPAQYERLLVPSTSTCRRSRRIGAACSAATGWSTWRTRWLGWVRSACGPTSRCARAAAATTWCCCSSSRRGDRSWPGSCTATRRGTPTRVSGWCSTRRRCRPCRTRCSAGRRWASGSTTCGSSAT